MENNKLFLHNFHKATQQQPLDPSCKALNSLLTCFYTDHIQTYKKFWAIYFIFSWVLLFLPYALLMHPTKITKLPFGKPIPDS